jgi:hypothetical protein
LKIAARDKVAEQAQSVIRKLTQLLGDHRGMRSEIPKRGTIEVLVDEPGHTRMQAADAEIVEVGRAPGTVVEGPLLVTSDYYIQARAASLGVGVAQVPEGWRRPLSGAGAVTDTGTP